MKRRETMVRVENVNGKKEREKDKRKEGQIKRMKRGK